MTKLNNDILKNPRYITKSKISRRELNKMHIPKSITIQEAKGAFDNCFGELVKTGIPYNENFQRHTKVVSKFELYNEIVKGRSSNKRKQINRFR